MTSFIERCRQVWLTWYRWPVFQALLGIVIAEWLLISSGIGSFLFRSWVMSHWGVWLRTIAETLTLISSITGILLIVAIPVLIVRRIKEQMTDWRSALTPDYRRAHLLVSAAIFLALVCLPLILEQLVELTRQWDVIYHKNQSLLYRNHGGIAYADYGFIANRVWPAIAGLAWSFLIVMWISWGTVWVSLWALPVFLGVLWFLIIVFNSVVSHLMQTVSNEPGFIFSLISFDALLFTGLWMHLGRLWAGRESLKVDERAPWLSGMLVALKPQPPGVLMRAGLWRRVSHRRKIGLDHRFIWLVALLIAIPVFAAPMLFNGIVWDGREGYAFAAMMSGAIICALCVGLSWPQRFAELNEVELLRPAPREKCAKEMGLAMFSDAAELSVAMLAALFVPLAFWSPEIFSTEMFWRAVAATILAQALVFGAVVWTMLLRSTAASMIALALSIFTLTQLLYWAMDESSLTPSLAAGAIGVALAVHAYRRWLHADLI